jgi:hypothetical protein
MRRRAILSDIIEKGLDPKVAHKLGPDRKLEKKESLQPVLEPEESVSAVAEEENSQEKIEVIQEQESVPKKKSNRFKKKTQES